MAGVRGPIGTAKDFYRLRTVRLTVADAPTIDWRDDVLYRRPPAEEPRETDRWVVQAVLLDDDEVVVPLAEFDDPAAAHEWADDAERDLEDMTRSEFEETYFPE